MGWEWDQEELSAAVKPWGVTWHFNPAEASDRGGVFESLIRPCRQILESISSDFIVPSREVSGDPSGRSGENYEQPTPVQGVQ
jgi:hypothetical protein